MITTADVSGDRIGAWLINKLREKKRDLKIFGIGGPLMQREGCAIKMNLRPEIFIGIPPLKKFFRLFRINQSLKKIISSLLEEKPQIVILITSAELNFRVAKLAQKRGIPTVYFLPPDQWAYRWRNKRAKKIFRLSDSIITVLPFERDFYRDLGKSENEKQKVRYFGNPIINMIDPLEQKKEEILKECAISSNQKKIIGLFPGSRQGEVEKLLPIIIQAASMIKKDMGKMNQEIEFILPLAAPYLSEHVQEILVRCLNNIERRERPSIKNVEIAGYKVMSVCDLILLASGTAALEATLLKKPMVVVYKLSLPSLLFAWLFLKERRFFSLPNFIINKKEGGEKNIIVPELIQRNATPEKISKKVIEILQNKNGIRNRMLVGFEEIRNELIQEGMVEIKIVDFIFEEVSRVESQTTIENRRVVKEQEERQPKQREERLTEKKIEKDDFRLSILREIKEQMEKVLKQEGKDELDDYEKRKKEVAKFILEEKKEQIKSFPGSSPVEEEAEYYFELASNRSASEWLKADERSRNKKMLLPPVGNLLKYAIKKRLVETHQNPPHIVSADIVKKIEESEEIKDNIENQFKKMIDLCFRHIPQKASENELLQELEIQLFPLYEKFQLEFDLIANYIVSGKKPLYWKRHVFLVILGLHILQKTLAAQLVTYNPENELFENPKNKIIGNKHNKKG